MFYDPKKRAEEKQKSRDQDARDLASGKKSAEELRRENAAFAFPPEKVRICWDLVKKFS